MLEKFVDFRANREQFTHQALARYIFPTPEKAQHSPRRSRHSSSKSLKDSSSKSRIDYNKLVSAKYPAKVFKIFLKIILFTPKIILEEDSPLAAQAKAQKKRSLSEKAESSLEAGLSNTRQRVLNASTKSVINSTFLTEKNELASILDQKKSKISNVSNASNIDSDNLTEEEIKRIIEIKMRKLERHNQALEKRDRKKLKDIKLSERGDKALRRFQKRFRGYLIKKNFFKAIRMNDYIELKKNQLKLKKCLEKFDKKYSTFLNLNNNSVHDFFIG